MKRVSKARPGELKIAWGKIPHEAPDVVYAWGSGCSKRDSNLLYAVFAAADLFKRLSERGYDITTLKFSIRKSEILPTTENITRRAEEKRG